MSEKVRKSNLMERFYNAKSGVFSLLYTNPLVCLRYALRIPKRAAVKLSTGYNRIEFGSQ